MNLADSYQTKICYTVCRNTTFTAQIIADFEPYPYCQLPCMTLKSNPSSAFCTIEKKIWISWSTVSVAKQRLMHIFFKATTGCL